VEDKVEAEDKAEAAGRDAPEGAADWVMDAGLARAVSAYARIAKLGSPIGAECHVLKKSVPNAAT